MIFALSPQGKDRVERAAGTFQGWLVTELGLAKAGSVLEANGVLKQFLPRFNRRFGVPPVYREPAADPVLQAPQESGQGQHGEVPAAHPVVAAKCGPPQLCRGGCGSSRRTGRPAFSAA